MSELEIRPVDDELIEIISEKILKAIDENNRFLMGQVISDYYPIDIAEVIYAFEDSTIIDFYTLVQDKDLADILEQADEDLQIKMIDLLDSYRAIFVFSFMSKDDVVDILGNLPIYKRKSLFKLMKETELKTIQTLLGYDEDTAGGIMSTEYIALYDDLSVEEALREIKTIAPRSEVIEVLFILNRKSQLVGVADLRDILIAADNVKLADICEKNLITVVPDMDQESVALLVSKYDLNVVPVVGKRNSLLGIITVDDVIDVIVEETTEDILHMAGVSEGETINGSVIGSIKKRFPWLLVNLVTAFCAAAVISMFEGTIEQVVALAAAMPIVTGMGGNAGSQTLSITIRHIALGELNFKNDWKIVFKEILIGLVHGIAIGIIAGFILYLRYKNIYLGLIMILAMVCNMIIAGIVGYLVPLMLKSLKVDPALASSIFVTALTDICGFLIFLGLAKTFILYLL